MAPPPHKTERACRRSRITPHRASSPPPRATYAPRAAPLPSRRRRHDDQTLVGLVCLELDVALKAVGGTSKGGLFCDAAERDAFLGAACAPNDWGPNGQRELQGQRGVAGDGAGGAVGAVSLEDVAAAWPSFRTSEQMFGGDAVLEVYRAVSRAGVAASFGSSRLAFQGRRARMLRRVIVVEPSRCAVAP